MSCCAAVGWVVSIAGSIILAFSFIVSITTHSILWWGVGIAGMIAGFAMCIEGGREK